MDQVQKQAMEHLLVLFRFFRFAIALGSATPAEPHASTQGSSVAFVRKKSRGCKVFQLTHDARSVFLFGNEAGRELSVVFLSFEVVVGRGLTLVRSPF